MIDLAAIRHNVAQFVHATGSAEVMAVVKADGYGHGAAEVGRAALDAGASRLGVAHVAEAISLRHHGIDAPLLAWLHTVNTDFEGAIENDIQLGVSGPELAAVAGAAKRPERSRKST